MNNAQHGVYRDGIRRGRDPIRVSQPQGHLDRERDQGDPVSDPQRLGGGTGDELNF